MNGIISIFRTSNIVSWPDVLYGGGENVWSLLHSFCDLLERDYITYEVQPSSLKAPQTIGMRSRP